MKKGFPEFQRSPNRPTIINVPALLQKLFFGTAYFAAASRCSLAKRCQLKLKFISIHYRDLLLKYQESVTMDYILVNKNKQFIYIKSDSFQSEYIWLSNSSLLLKKQLEN